MFINPNFDSFFYVNSNFQREKFPVRVLMRILCMIWLMPTTVSLAKVFNPPM